ncbi:hypothetical protein CPB86DRAFT_878432 [Serendipita vermifera]|nr:hypothetical protein CPB86DRAFT_878432 [Serendipita vermifera]
MPSPTFQFLPQASTMVCRLLIDFTDWSRLAIEKYPIFSEPSGNSYGSEFWPYSGLVTLAGYTATPAAKDSGVECWDEDEDGNVVEANVDGYSNDVYHARYRVLQAFAFFNCILLMFLFLFILALAVWHHKRGRYVIWTTPTTSVGWYDGPTGHGTGRRVPAPVTERKSHKSKGDRYEKWDDEKQVDSGRKRHFNFDKSEETLVDEEKEDLIKRPPPAATRHNSNSSQLKPRQNLVSVPAGQGRAKPILAPIAAKMAEERQKAETSRDGPDRKPSQREAADKARQLARRDRGGATDDERPSRPAVRQTSSAGVKRSASNPNGRANASDNERRPAVARRDGSAQPTARAPRRETSQTRAPGVQRSGSGAGNNTGRREPSRTRQQSSNEDGDRYQSKNPYRPSGRRL